MYAKTGDLFSALGDRMKSEVKGRVQHAKQQLNEYSEKVLQDVVESETFQKHVAFKIEDHVNFDGFTAPRIITNNANNNNNNNNQSSNNHQAQFSVFVSRAAGLKAKHGVYIQLELEGRRTRTPVAEVERQFDFDGKMHDWSEHEHTLRLPVSDLNGTAVIRVFAEGSILQQDEFLGAVLLPLHRIAPEEGPLVYQLFSLPLDRQRFLPAVAGASHTGMDKHYDLGFIRARSQLTLRRPDVPIWQSLVTVPPYHPPGPVDNVSVDPARTQRHWTRQIWRLETVLDRYVMDPISMLRPFSFARSWASRKFSITFIPITCICILHLPNFLLPMYLFTILLIGSLLTKSIGKEDPPIIWNEDIRDPDARLNPMQRIAKILWIIDGVSKTMLSYSQFFEKVFHAFDFQEEHITTVLLVLGFVFSFSLSLFAYFVEFRTIVLLLYLYYTFTTVDLEMKYKKLKFFYNTGLNIDEQLQEEEEDHDHDHENLDQELNIDSGKSQQQNDQHGNNNNNDDDDNVSENDQENSLSLLGQKWIQQPKLKLASTFLSNIISRIPTSEDLAHRYICDEQIVKNRAVIERVERISRQNSLKTD